MRSEQSCWSERREDNNLSGWIEKKRIILLLERRDENLLEWFKRKQNKSSG
jgi:hypothetical protein